MPELVLDRVTKQFKNKIAVDGVSLQLGTGVYGFLGANGAGKTTLLRMLCGVLKPTAGEIICNGIEIGALDGEYRRMLGYLPQDFGYYPGYTARRYLEYLAACKAVPKDIARDKVQEMLQLVGLKEAAKQKIRTFSGGMLRRLGIAQALLNDPEILLMKKGRIVKQGTTQEVTDSLAGKVWEYLAEPREAARLNASFAVSNLRNVGDKVHLRLLSHTCPCEGAVNTAPGLEDVYLYYFEEVSEHVENLERRGI